MSKLILEDKMTSMCAGVDYSINEVIDYNKGLFTVYAQYVSIKNNLCQLLLHSCSINRSGIK